MTSHEDGPIFLNPIIPGFNPDPTVCVVPATDSTPTTYFLSTSTFEYFPGCAIYTSADLINWKLIGHALTRRSQIELRTVEPGAGSWASTLRYRPQEKRWYLANGLFQRYRPTSDVSKDHAYDFETILIRTHRSASFLGDSMSGPITSGMRTPGQIPCTLTIPDSIKM